MLHISYLYRIHTVPFLLFRAYNTGNQLIMHSVAVKIGNSVTTIKGGAFSECSKIQDVYCYTAEPPQAIDSYFTFAFNATLHVPAESLDKYSSITPWDNFGSIVPLTGQELAIKKHRSLRQHSDVSLCKWYYNIWT